MNALVTGATGFIGRHLLARLDRPVVLSRDAPRAQQELKHFDVRAFDWNVEAAPPPAGAFEGVDTILHLAGEPVAEGRWNTQKKARIRDSRVIGTRNLVSALARLTNKPQTLISASAVGYYGSRGDEELTEQSLPGSDFLAEVCVAWEKEAAAARQLGIRVVPIRFGIVLGRGGGALAKMLPPFKMGMGSPLGSGNQYMPWIHIDDLIELLLFAARELAIDAPLNGTSPSPVTNREFTKTLGRALNRPTILPAVPAFVLKTMVGDFAEVLLASQRVVPKAALAAGFHFRYTELEPAINDLLKS